MAVVACRLVSSPICRAVGEAQVHRRVELLGGGLVLVFVVVVMGTSGQSPLVKSEHPDTTNPLAAVALFCGAIGVAKTPPGCWRWRVVSSPGTG